MAKVFFLRCPCGSSNRSRGVHQRKPRAHKYKIGIPPPPEKIAPFSGAQLDGAKKDSVAVLFPCLRGYNSVCWFVSAHLSVCICACQCFFDLALIKSVFVIRLELCNEPLPITLYLGLCHRKCFRWMASSSFTLSCSDTVKELLKDLGWSLWRGEDLSSGLRSGCWKVGVGLVGQAGKRMGGGGEFFWGGGGKLQNYGHVEKTAARAPK